jgi:hypothetical protein
MTRSTQTPDIDSADMPELTVPLDTVCFIIDKAREFDVKAGSSDPDASELDDDDIDAAVLEDRPSDPVEDELKSVISDLADDAQVDLVTLMWLGRDDGSVEEWAETRQIATDEHNNNTAGYLVGTPLLADHLEAGLDIIGLSCAAEHETQV